MTDRLRFTRPAEGPGEVLDMTTPEGAAAVNAHQQDLWSPRGQQRIAMQTSRNSQTPSPVRRSTSS